MHIGCNPTFVDAASHIPAIRLRRKASASSNKHYPPDLEREPKAPALDLDLATFAHGSVLVRSHWGGRTRFSR
jgi:hypothetical protein